MRVSISDVATKAGTSVSTVSKVLSSTQGYRISEATAKRVRQAARELNYRPSSTAQQLRLRRTDTIEIVVPFLTTPFYVDIIRGIQEVMWEHGRTVILGISDEDSALERRHLTMALQRRVDGLIVAPARNNENADLYDELKDAGIPFVFVDRYLPDYEANSVCTDNREGAYRATRHLLAQGARKICYIGGRGGIPALAERLGGYQEALEEEGIEVDPSLVGGGIPAEIAQAARRFLAVRPRIEGAFMSSYLYLQVALPAFIEAGIRIPEDLPMVGFDSVFFSLSDGADYEAAQAITAPLPTVIQPRYAIGRKAAEILLTDLSRGGTETFRQIRLAPLYERIDTDGPTVEVS